MCEQLLLWAPVDNLNTSLQWKTIAHEFYLHSCTVRQVFCLFTLYSVFLVWKLLYLWWVVVPAISRKSHSKFCFISDQRLSCHEFVPLSIRLMGFHYKTVLPLKVFFTLVYSSLQYFFLIALSIKQIKFKSSAIRNLLFTIRLTRDFLDIAIVRYYTTPKTSVFPYLLLFYWEFEPCCLQHAF